MSIYNIMHKNKKTGNDLSNQLKRTVPYITYIMAVSYYGY